MKNIQDVIAICPRVGQILKSAENKRGAGWHDYERYKAELSRVVGFFAEDPRLNTSETYECAISALDNALITRKVRIGA